MLNTDTVCQFYGMLTHEYVNFVWKLLLAIIRRWCNSSVLYFASTSTNKRLPDLRVHSSAQYRNFIANVIRFKV